MTEIKNAERKLERSIQGIESRLQSYENRIQSLETTRQAAHDFQANFQANKTTLHKFIVAVGRTLDLEDGSRLSNLIIYGVPDTEEETNDSLYTATESNISEQILNVNVKYIERLHRLGRGGSDRPTPVIIKLHELYEKMNILKNCYRLKGTDFSIREDYLMETRQIRKLLWDSSSDIRRDGVKASLVHDKLRIGKELFAWDATKNTRVKLPSRTRERDSRT